MKDSVSLNELVVPVLKIQRLQEASHQSLEQHITHKKKTTSYLLYILLIVIQR